MVERMVSTNVMGEELTFSLPMEIKYDRSTCQYFIHVLEAHRAVDDIAAKYELSEVYPQKILPAKMYERL